MNEKGYEQMMEDVFFKHCSKQALKYWINWVARCFLLFTRHKEEVVDNFLTNDTTIKKWINLNLACFNPDDEVLRNFDDKFTTFIAFLQKVDDNVKLNPTQIFALFHHLCNDESSTTDENLLLSHMNLFAKDGSSMRKRSLWEKDLDTPRRDYFNECLTTMASWTEPANILDTRPVTPKLKKQVWKKAVNKGKCDVCNKSIVKDNFEAGHVIARSLGGQTELNNLIPMCFDCNRNMGTRNAYEFKQDVYPRLCAYINVN
jgi:hypothetical protein